MENNRNDVFVSYSHKDKRWLDQLHTHLRPLTREHKIDLWDDSRIQPGANWRNEIQQAIDKAKVAILLISANFLASDFIHENELPPLLEKAKMEGALIFPIVISHCRFVETKNISQFQAVNDPIKPLASINKAKQDRVFAELSKYIDQVFSKPLLDELENEVRDLNRGKEDFNSETNDTLGEFTSVSTISFSVLEKTMQFARTSVSIIPGLATGFRGLDQFTSGFQPSELILLSARPHMGITAFAQSIALNASILENRTIAFFSMKSTKDSIGKEMLCAEAKVDKRRFDISFLTRAEWGRLSEAIGTLQKSAIFVDDTTDLSIEVIQAKIKKLLAEQKKLDLIIVDNLEYLSSSKKTKESDADLSQLAYEFKRIAKEFQIPVIILCHLPPKETSRYYNRPTLSDLSKLATVQQFADVSIILHREHFYEPCDENVGLAEIVVTRNDTGATEIFKLAFLEQFNKFTEVYLDEKS